MRVVLPYTRLHPATARLANRHLPGHDRAYVGGSSTDYHDLVAALWGAGEDFLLVEHDIGVHAHVLPQLTGCPGLWCGFVYPHAGRVAAAFGCTRFRAALMAAEPDLLHAAGTVHDDMAVGPRDWRRLDSRVYHQLHLRGYTRCDHTPAVAHYGTNR